MIFFVTKLKKQHPRVSFLKTNASSQYNANSLQGSSLSQGFYFLFQNTKLQPGIWLPEASLFPLDAIAYFTIESCSQNSDGSIQGYPLHRALLCPLPASMAIPLIHCSQAHFCSWTYTSVLSCKLGMEDAGGHSGGGWHGDRRGAVCTLR